MDKGAHSLLSIRQITGQVDDKSQSGELGGLNGHRAESNPTTGSVDLGADSGHQDKDQADQCNPDHWKRKTLQATKFNLRE